MFIFFYLYSLISKNLIKTNIKKNLNFICKTNSLKVNFSKVES